ncbi:MAG TPA: hypothetical protein DIW20_08920 [Rhodospirillaceae bacterium]|nr:hypothetical protein [Rhodospirillaceae bacterium]
MSQYTRKTYYVKQFASAFFKNLEGRVPQILKAVTAATGKSFLTRFHDTVKRLYCRKGSFIRDGQNPE